MTAAPARRLALPTSALVLAALLTACGGGSTSAGTPPEPAEDVAAPPSAAPTAFAESDVTFLQDMIPHHAQAVEMAQLAADRTTRPELLTFADQVIADQSREVDRMEALLETAGAEPAAHMGGMDHGGSMPGMMTAAEMTELEGLRDAEFDLAFLRMMTAHHEGAIEMAEAQQAGGANLEVTELAASIAAAQRAEIEQMAAWQDAWS